MNGWVGAALIFTAAWGVTAAAAAAFVVAVVRRGDRQTLPANPARTVTRHA